MRRIVAFLVSILLLMLVGFLTGLWTAPWFQGMVRQTRTLESEGKSFGFPVNALGKIQPGGGVISVTGTPGDIIKDLFVRQGKEVTRKDKLVEMVSHADNEQNLILATTRLDEARTRLELLKIANEDSEKRYLQKSTDARASAREKSKLESFKINASKEKVRGQRDQLERLESLDPTRVNISAQERENTRLGLTLAQAELDAATASRDFLEAELARQTRDFASARKSAEDEYQLSRLSISIPSLEAQKKIATQQLDRSLLRSRVDGTVLKIFVEQGDSVSTSPILQIAADRRMVVMAEVNAVDIPVLREAVETKKKVYAKVTSPVFREKVMYGELADRSAISNGVARNALIGFNPRADSDRRVIEVRVDLDPDSTIRAREFIGLEVTVRFDDKPLR